MAILLLFSLIFLSTPPLPQPKLPIEAAEVEEDEEEDLDIVIIDNVEEDSN